MCHAATLQIKRMYYSCQRKSRRRSALADYRIPGSDVVRQKYGHKLFRKVSMTGLFSQLSYDPKNVRVSFLPVDILLHMYI